MDGVCDCVLYIGSCGTCRIRPKTINYFFQFIIVASEKFLCKGVLRPGGMSCIPLSGVSATLLINQFAS